MDVNYNDGEWHPAPRGKWPVHPKSVVQWVLRSEMPGSQHYRPWTPATGEAEVVMGEDSIIAFRVVKEHKEPREYWVTVCNGYTHAHQTKAAAQTYCDRNTGAEMFLVREVMDGAE